MSVYLTGVGCLKAKKTKESPKKQNSSNNNTEKLHTSGNIKEDAIISENIQNIKKPIKSILKHKKTQLKSEDKKIHKKNNFLSEKDFEKTRNKTIQKKNNYEKIFSEIKDNYLDYLMLKEPKFADFEKISEDYTQKIYKNYQIYNNNLILISKKKQKLKEILAIVEKSLINNYYLKDSSMLPVYEQLIEKIKIDIIKKQQEHDSYQKIYDELYTENYLVNRNVLDEIELIRINENFYGQYKILQNHAIGQVSKKQDMLNQIEEYNQKMIEEHKKEINKKNNILKDLKVEIEVFKEDEKELLNKLKKLKMKREMVKAKIKEENAKYKMKEKQYPKIIKKYQKCFIGLHKIFKSVNAKNLDDVLLDVNVINGKFNTLKNKSMSLNQEISNLNSILSQLNRKLNEINDKIILSKNKYDNIFKDEEQKIIDFKQNLIKEHRLMQYKLKEEIPYSVGVFDKGIVFLFQKIRIFLAKISKKKFRTVLTRKLISIINEYENAPFIIDYNNIDRKFIKDFSFLFIQFGNIILYFTLNSMCNRINTNNNEINKKYIISISDPISLKIYKDSVKNSLEEYKYRSALKLEKQKEVNERIKKKELQKQIEDQLIEANKVMSQEQLFNRFFEFLENNNKTSKKKKKKFSESNLDNNTFRTNSFLFSNYDNTDNSNTKNQFQSNSRNFDSSSSYVDSDFIIFKNNIKNHNSLISLKEKQEFLKKNKNRLMSIFSKYHNSLVRKNIFRENILVKGKPSSLKKLSRPKSQISIHKYIINGNKKRLKKEISAENENEKKIVLLDDDYVYDKEDTDYNEQKKKITPKSGFLNRKRKINISSFTFFKYDKDRANIYKRANDLRKLQMAYFGGRFFGTFKQGEFRSINYFDEFINNFLSRKNLHKHVKIRKKSASYKKIEIKKKSLDEVRNKNNLNKDINDIKDKNIHYKKEELDVSNGLKVNNKSFKNNMPVLNKENKENGMVKKIEEKSPENVKSNIRVKDKKRKHKRHNSCS